MKLFPALALSALLLLPASVAGALLDRSRFCTFGCPPTTPAGAAWASSLRTGVLRCTYADAASCLYSRVREPPPRAPLTARR